MEGKLSPALKFLFIYLVGLESELMAYKVGKQVLYSLSYTTSSFFLQLF
jgi:hypothetical protein